MPFDIDLYDWGEKREPQKVLVDPEKLRFWGSSSSQAEGEMEVPGSQETRRKIDFSGRFEPVEWSCRAPLPSGKLCPRRDRVKCPLHGKIVARWEDQRGNSAMPKSNLPLATCAEMRRDVRPTWRTGSGRTRRKRGRLMRTRIGKTRNCSRWVPCVVKRFVPMKYRRVSRSRTWRRQLA